MHQRLPTLLPIGLSVVLVAAVGCGSQSALSPLILVDCDGNPITVEQLDTLVDPATPTEELIPQLEELCITDQEVQFLIINNFEALSDGTDIGDGDGDGDGGDGDGDTGGDGDGDGGILLG